MLKGLGKFSVTSNVGTAPSINKRSAPELRHKTVANMSSLGNGSGGGYAGGFGSSGAAISSTANVMKNVVDDFIPANDLVAISRIYQDIYFHDSVGGTAVDLLSTLPWSDFTLTGISDQEQQTVYSNMVENLHFKSLLPEISVSYLVSGTFVAILNFSAKEKNFISIAPQDISLCEVQELPIYGVDPLVNVKIPANIIKMIQQAGKDKRLKGLLEQLPDFMVKNAKKGAIELNPANALYIPRRTFATTAIGTSYFRRLLPLYILEKALLRGTIDSAYKRQRGVLHLICLTGDTMVSVDGKLQRLDSIHSHDGMRPGDAKNVDFITKGKDGKLVRAKKWIYQGRKSVRKVTTESGHTVKGTADHRLLVLTKNADVVWRQIQDLDHGDFLCLDPGLANAKIKQLALNTENYEPLGPGGQPYTAKVPKFMTPDLGYMIGLLLSDGTIRDYTYGISNTDCDIVERYTDCNKSIFGMDTRIDTKEAGVEEVMGQLCDVKEKYMATTNCSHVIDTLRQIGVASNRDLNPLQAMGKISNRKLLPWSITQADTESKLAFIAGYIDGDGTVLHNKDTGAIELRIASTSKKMLRQLQTMLLDMGVRSTIEGINLYIGRTDGTRIYQTVRKYLAAKSKIFEHELPVIRDRQFGLPLSVLRAFVEKRYVGRAAERRQYLFKNDDGEVVHVPYWGRIADAIFNGRQRINLGYDAWQEGQFDKLLEAMRIISPRMVSKLENLMRIGYLFEPVCKVAKLRGKKHVYDLSIEKGEEPAFVANGIVAHNCGDADWEPTSEELSSVVNMFIAAGLDPTGAMVATRDGIQTNEVLNATDFWKHEDSEPSLTSQKMRALGINDSLFDNSATFSTLEASLSTFMEQLRTYREMIVRKIFYNKLFPSIAVANDFKKTEKEMHQTLGSVWNGGIGHNSNRRFDVLCDGNSLAPNLKDLNVDINEYHIPRIHFHKSLQVTQDETYLGILATLEERGVPITLRQWAAAGGVSLSELMNSMEEDVETREKIVKDWSDKKPKTPQQQLQEMTSAMQGVGSKRVGLGNRKFQPEEIRDPETGRILSSKGRKVLTEKVHKNTAHALARIAMRNNHRIKQGKPATPTKTTSNGPFGRI